MPIDPYFCKHLLVWYARYPAYFSLWNAGQLPNEISGKIGGLPEGLVTQMGVPLGHGRAFVS